MIIMSAKVPSYLITTNTGGNPGAGTMFELMRQDYKHHWVTLFELEMYDVAKVSILYEVDHFNCLEQYLAYKYLINGL